MGAFEIDLVVCESEKETEFVVEVRPVSYADPNVIGKGELGISGSGPLYKLNIMKAKDKFMIAAMKRLFADFCGFDIKNLVIRQVTGKITQPFRAAIYKSFHQVVPEIYNDKDEEEIMTYTKKVVNLATEKRKEGQKRNKNNDVGEVVVVNDADTARRRLIQERRQNW